MIISFGALNMGLLEITAVVFILTANLSVTKSQQSGEVYSDVVFLVDGSRYARPPAFQKVKNFITQIIDKLNIVENGYRIGLAQYSGDAKTEFLLNRFQQKDEVMNYLRRNYMFKGGGALRTGRAISHLQTNFFTTAAGSRQVDGVPQIAVVITTARSQDDVEADSKALKKRGVRIISVGIGNSDISELEKIAFLPNYPFLFQTSGFENLIRASEVSSAIMMITQREFLHKEIKAPAACKSANLADIVFLVDQSRSIGERNFQLIRLFLTRFINALDVAGDKIHIGLVQYNTVAFPEFYFTTYQSKNEMIQHIKKTNYRGGEANTGAALDYIRLNYFTPHAGGRKKQGIPQIAIVITDGKSKYDVKKAASALRRTGVTVYAVGTKDANQNELSKIASYPSENFVSTIESFGRPSNIERILQKRVCVEIINQNSVLPEKVTQLQEGCMETDEADLFFLIHGSDSIKPEDFTDMKQFMLDIIHKFKIGVDRVRVSVVQYGYAPQTVFSITQYTTNKDVEAAIKRMTLIRELQTVTGKALEFIKDRFKEIDQSDKNRAQRFLITITDQKSEDDVSIPASELRQRGVVVYSIGVEKADHSEMFQIAGDLDRMFYTDNYDALTAIKNKVLRDMCSKEACSKLEVADIIFLIDGSRSIYFKDFITMKVFMETLINKTQVGENRVQFGVIQFSTQTQLEFQLNQYYDKDKLMQAVGDIQQLEGLTSTGKALNFTAKYFDEAQGGRPHERQYLIVITDGEAQDEVYTPAKAIRDKGITVFAIGVYNANNSQLVDIAGSQDQVYHVENFDALGSLEKLISFEVCSPLHECKRIEVADIVFVISGSDSIGAVQLDSMKRFMIAVANRSEVDAKGVQFGVVLYGDSPQTKFQMNEFHSKAGIRTAISQIQKTTSGSASAAKALKHAAGLLSSEKGGRKSQEVPQFLIVITDTKAADAVDLPAITKGIREDNIKIYGIGVGRVEQRELEKITGSTEGNFYAQDFGQLQDLSRIISQLLCNGSKLACELSKADIVFLLDSSESIKKHQFQLEKDFLKDFTDMFEISQDKFQFGVAQYSTNQKAEFYLNQYHDRMMLNRSIQNIVQLQEGTKTGKALKYIDHFFQPEKGSRKKEGVPQFLLVITDGESQDDVSLPAEALRRNNIIIFALGIDKVEKKHMVEITGDPQKTYIIKEFTDLSKFKKRLVRTICVTEEQKVSPECTMDIAVGFDLPRRSGKQTLFTGQMQLQAKIDEILFMITSITGSSCTADSKADIRLGFHIKDRNGLNVFETQFENYNQEIVDKLKAIQTDASINLNAETLKSFSNKFNTSDANSKVVLIFTDGLDDTEVRLNDAAEKLREEGVSALITVTLEGAVNIKKISRIEFGNEFGYKQQLFIGMQDIGGSLKQEISAIMERDCFNFRCICIGDPGLLGGQGFRGPKGSHGLKGTLGFPGEEGGMGERGPPGFNGTRGVQGCPGPRGPKGGRGHRGQKGHAGEHGINGINGEQGNHGIPGSLGEKGYPGNLGKRGPPGTRGERGEQNARGDSGEPGIDSTIQGLKGERGNIGPPGDPGTDGTPGIRGPVGNPGVEGRRGQSVAQGEKGQRGDRGRKGDPGTRGLPGQPGGSGIPGLRGEQGHRGIQGPPGIPGPDGEIGNSGVKGPNGLFGDPGKKGERGPRGARGFVGMDGRDGFGFPGLKGKKGEQGNPGYVGAEGADGKPGITGNRGSKGIRGRRGNSGDAGDLGDPGSLGGPGRAGPKGPQGRADQRSCNLISYVRDNCPCCSRTGRGCPAYPTELVFALDVSADVTQAVFLRMKRVVLTLLQDINIAESNCPTGARVSVVTSNTTVQTSIRFSDFKKKKLLLDKIEQLEHERSTGSRKIDTVMMFVARNTFKRVRNGVLVRKIAVFITNGDSPDTTAISTAAMILQASNIIPVVISFSAVPEVLSAFLAQGGEESAVFVLPRQMQSSREMLQNIRLCRLCYDECNPDASCSSAPRSLTVPLSLDMAFVVDDLERLNAAESRTVQHFLSSMFDTFLSTSESKDSMPHPRVALVQHTPGYAPRFGDDPFNLEFGILDYPTKSIKKRHVQDALFKVDGSSSIANTIEWSLNNFFLNAPDQKQYKVIFTIFSGETNILDKKKLMQVSREAKCKGIVMFALALGRGTNSTILKNFASFPFEQHLLRLDRALEAELGYAQKFALAFLNNLATGINSYPPAALARECRQQIKSQDTIGKPETIPSFKQVEMAEDIEDGDDINSYDVCALNVDEGNCRNYILKWFFNQELKRCQQFWFSGCRGNRNRFDTKQECEDLCLKRAW
eukprot:gi/632945099/ref/XP_007887867.1/ PREDICTED: collagen alpha-6(VI) chain-like isoform X1 [Callorhinchus milii]